jgi:hypothetical protein
LLDDAPPLFGSAHAVPLSAAVWKLKGVAVEKWRVLRWRFLPSLPPNPFLLLRFLLPADGAFWA